MLVIVLNEIFYKTYHQFEADSFSPKNLEQEGVTLSITTMHQTAVRLKVYFGELTLL